MTNTLGLAFRAARVRGASVLFSTCALTALATVSMGGGAFAQTPGDSSAGQNGDQIETVVVTAEKRNQKFIDVPTSLAVYTSKDIQDDHLIALSDIAARTPNVVMSGSSIY